ncbi:MAG: carbohydrate binding domain-containing protein [Eubacterium sp.]|nr:carbohydrate binding domain-containing protein [Eubacterium sp.]
MPKKKSLLRVILALALCLIVVTAPVTASVAKPEITVRTDKKEYSGDETITAVIEVNNVTGNDLSDIVLSGLIPGGYETEAGVAGSDKWTAKLDEVEADSTGSVTVAFTKKKEAVKQNGSVDNDTTDKNSVNAGDQTKSDKTDATVIPADTVKVVAENNSDKNINTGDDTELLFFAVLAVFSLAGMILLVRSKKGKRILSMILAVAVGGSLFMVRGNVKIFAADSKMVAGTPEFAENESNLVIAGKASQNGGSENLTEEASVSFMIDGQETTISVNIDYVLEYGSQDLSYAGYTLQWQDEFNGTALNRDDWNVETHDPGWVNSELQSYVDSTENIYVKDGSLVIKPVKNGNSYTSGRVNTQNKHDFKYGLFEAKVKVPSGAGYLPAFWLMPTNENLYGQWPRCGEIDAMEVMGQETDLVYGTIHYGNPHSESQGTKKLTDGDFSEEYHVFAVEWEPGSIKWYVDGMLYHEEHDWYSTTVGQGTVSYPAPFDQSFYVILNLAIGGSWVGNPDEYTSYEDQTYEIDYVRVFQKDSYDENVERPEQKEVVLRNPDASGNYIINGDFAVNEALDDEEDWILLTTLGGEATAEIKDEVLAIKTSKAGTADYSVQFVQGGLPAEKGATYRLSFDAWADAERTAIINIDAVDRGYTRYLPDTKIDLTVKKQSYSFEYTMKDENDGNSRFEVNLGNTDSKATFYLDNVRLEKIAQEDYSNKKEVLSDGNYVYNGKFQEGTGRLAYWEFDNKAGAEISVTNDKEDDRRLKVVVPEGTSEKNPVIIWQGDLPLTPNTEFEASYDADGDVGKTIKASFAGFALDAALTGKSQTLKTVFTTGEKVDNRVIFTITEPGTYYIDNVSVVENKLIKNGSFNANLVAYDPFIDGSASATYVVDSINEDNAFDITIKDTGDQDYKVQLKQAGVRLEQGQWYRLKLDMKSNLDRKVVVAIQRNGNNDATKNDWTPYIQETVGVGSDYQTYTFEFQMNPETAPFSDDDAIFNVAMGAVAGDRIKTEHRICIDNISLEKIDAPEIVLEPKPYNTELLTNGKFNGTDGWSKLETAICGEATGTVTVADGKVNLNITNPGTADWNVQLITDFDVQLEPKEKYILSFKAKAADKGNVKFDFMTSNYNWYMGSSVQVTNEEQTYTIQLTAEDKPINDKIAMFIGMGHSINNEAVEITLSDISLVKVEKFPEAQEQGGENEAGGESGQEEQPTAGDPNEQQGSGDASDTDDNNLLANATFADEDNDGKADGWTETIAVAAWGAGYCAEAVSSFANGIATYTITNPGTSDWNVQLKQTGIKLEAGKTYKVTIKASCDVERKINVGVMENKDDDPDWFGGGIYNLSSDESTIEFTFTPAKDYADSSLYISMGNPIDGVQQPTESVVTISSVKLEEAEE